MSRRIVAVTMGDPTGVGPEVVAKTLAERPSTLAIVVGDAAILSRAIRLLELPLSVNVVGSPREAAFGAGAIDLVAASQLPDDLPFGALDRRAGDAAYRYVRRAVELALADEVHALATAPLNKEAMQLAGHHYPGHTELLAELCDVKDYAMMLVTEELRVLHVSTHVSLAEAIERVQPERELTVIRLADRALCALGIEQPRIAVAGLNPHAGENGLFGTEDRERIAPAVRAAQDEGIDASGPWPADTVFMQARRGRFDAVVVQYHDQGHIPIKLMGFDTGVNVTVGLPFFRTSVDHGTAFDIAGKGEADAASMQAALELAAELARPAGERDVAA